MPSPLQKLPEKYWEYIPSESEVPAGVTDDEQAESYRAVAAIAAWAKDNTDDSEATIMMKIVRAVQKSNAHSTRDLVEIIPQ